MTADYGAPSDADEFIEAFLFPAFNVSPLVTGCDFAPNPLGSAAGLTLDVELEDGSAWQVSVVKRAYGPSGLPDLPTCATCGVTEGLHLAGCPDRFPTLPPNDGSLA